MRSEVMEPPFLTSTLDGVSGELHSPAALRPAEEPPVPIGLEAGWAPGASLDGVEKRNVEPVSFHYTG
jgi:hypothetical protein